MKKQDYIVTNKEPSYRKHQDYGYFDPYRDKQKTKKENYHPNHPSNLSHTGVFRLNTDINQYHGNEELHARID